MHAPHMGLPSRPPQVAAVSPPRAAPPLAKQGQQHQLRDRPATRAPHAVALSRSHTCLFCSRRDGRAGGASSSSQSTRGPVVSPGRSTLSISFFIHVDRMNASPAPPGRARAASIRSERPSRRREKNWMRDGLTDPAMRPCVGSLTRGGEINRRSRSCARAERRTEPRRVSGAGAGNIACMRHATVT